MLVSRYPNGERDDMKQRLTFLVTLAVSLTIPAGALAHSNLPEPDSYKIKVPTSIGGVELGQTLKAADKAWGGVGSCGSIGCQYGHLYADTGDATITRDGGVTDAAIYGDAVKGHEYRGSLSRFKTNRKIKLGSSEKAVKKAYPNAKSDGDKYFPRLIIKGKGKSFMWFGFDNGFVDSIGITDGKK